MQYISHYESPLGAITLAADEKGLTGLWFDGEKYFGNTLEAEYEEKETVILNKAEKASDPLTGDRISKSGLGNSFKYSLWTDGNLW